MISGEQVERAVKPGVQHGLFDHLFRGFVVRASVFASVTAAEVIRKRVERDWIQPGNGATLVNSYIILLVHSFDCAVEVSVQLL